MELEDLVVVGKGILKSTESSPASDKELKALAGSGTSSRDRSQSRSPPMSEFQHQVYGGGYGDGSMEDDTVRAEFRPVIVGVCAMEAKVCS